MGAGLCPVNALFADRMMVVKDEAGDEGWEAWPNEGAPVVLKVEVLAE